MILALEMKMVARNDSPYSDFSVFTAFSRRAEINQKIDHRPLEKLERNRNNRTTKRDAQIDRQTKRLIDARARLGGRSEIQRITLNLFGLVPCD